MAQQSEAGIPRAGKRKWGYDPAQVDAFLERAHTLYESEGPQLSQRDIQDVSFDLKRGGYVIAQVDAALARLEKAVVDKQTQWEISQQGRVAWKARTEELYREIAHHVEREERERFSPARVHAPAYDRKQVDRLSDQIVDKCAAALGVDGAPSDARLDKITSDSVANAVFTQRKGKKGYDERQVDYFLNTCVELLSRIESFDRIADYITADGDADGSAASLGSRPRPASDPVQPSPATPVTTAATAASATQSVPAAAGSVAPLFAADTRFRRAADADDAPQGYAPVSAAKDGDGQSFDALSQAEQNLFAAASHNAAAAPVPAVTPVEPVVAKPAPVASHPVPASPAAPAPTYTAPAPSPAPAPLFAASHAPSTPAPAPVVPTPVVSAPAPAAPAPAPQPVTPVAPAPQPATPPSFTPPVVHAPTPTPTVPAAPAPAAPQPAAPAPDPDIKHTTASLAALAQMAEASQEFPKVNGTTSFTPHMPSLDVPNTFTSMPPVVADAPRPEHAEHAAAPAPQAAAPADDGHIPSYAPASKPTRRPLAAHAASNPFSLLSTDNNDLDIPDLSFPSIGGDDEKKEQ